MVDYRLLAELAALKWEVEEQRRLQRQIAQYRDYFEGRAGPPLLERQKQYFGSEGVGSLVNVCRTVVTALVEKVGVAGFGSPDKEFAAWVQELWESQALEVLQDQLYEAVLVDGKAYLMVDYDQEAGVPRFYLHRLYVPPEFGGEGYGVWPVTVVTEESASQMEALVKFWVETVKGDKGLETRRRATVYFPDRIERYVATVWGWERLPGDEGVVEWTTPAGEPLGIPAVAFQNPGERSELHDLIPLQNALTRVWLDILSVVDTAGFPVYVALGFWPTIDQQPPKEDGSNLLKVAPGVWVGTTNPDASVKVIEPADVKPLLEVLKEILFAVSFVTGTPPFRFQFTRQVASHETLKQQEEPLLAKAKARQRLWGAAWARAFALAARLEEAFGERRFQNPVLEIHWKPLEARGDRDHLEALAIKREKLGIPLEQIWRELGYTQDQIEEMQSMPESQARLLALKMAQGE